MRVNSKFLMILCSLVVEGTQTAIQNSPEDGSRHLVRRQTPQFPIPILAAHYVDDISYDDIEGGDDPSDICERHEVLVMNGIKNEEHCYEILSSGPCQVDELVLVNATTKKGYCGSRVCGPDRVFLFGDQLCHDPLEPGICPPGRVLSTSAYGTPVCGCPDGTYESSDDLDNDVCDSILSETSKCPKGQVFWFEDFRKPPLCTNDPCNGVNLNRKPNELPFIPSYEDGQCYQIGTQPKICKPDTFYSIDLEKLKGVCKCLNETGYLEFDQEKFDTLISLFGEPLKYDDIDNNISIGNSSDGTSGDINIDNNGNDNHTNVLNPTNSYISQSGPNKDKKRPLTPASTTLIESPPVNLMMGSRVILPPSNILSQQVNTTNLQPVAFSWPPTYHIIVPGSITYLNFLPSLPETQILHRGMRRYLPHPPRHPRQQLFATPGNIFEPAMTSCRAGSSRGLNARCRPVILPARPPSMIPQRTVPPIPPSSQCLIGEITLGGRCGSTFNALMGLGR